MAAIIIIALLALTLWMIYGNDEQQKDKTWIPVVGGVLIAIGTVLMIIFMISMFGVW